MIVTKCCGATIKLPRKDKRKVCPHCGSKYWNGIQWWQRLFRASRAFWRVLRDDPVKAHRSRTEYTGQTVILEENGEKILVEHMD